MSLKNIFKPKKNDFAEMQHILRENGHLRDLAASSQKTIVSYYKACNKISKMSHGNSCKWPDETCSCHVLLAEEAIEKALIPVSMENEQ